MRPELMCTACRAAWQDGQPVRLEPSPGSDAGIHFVADECEHWPTSDPQWSGKLTGRLAAAVGRLTEAMQPGELGAPPWSRKEVDVADARNVLDQIESWYGKMRAFNPPKRSTPEELAS